MAIVELKGSLCPALFLIQYTYDCLICFPEHPDEVGIAVIATGALGVHLNYLRSPRVFVAGQVYGLGQL